MWWNEGDFVATRLIVFISEDLQKKWTMLEWIFASLDEQHDIFHHSKSRFCHFSISFEMESGNCWRNAYAWFNMRIKYSANIESESNFWKMTSFSKCIHRLHVSFHTRYPSSPPSPSIRGVNNKWKRFNLHINIFFRSFISTFAWFCGAMSPAYVQCTVHEKTRQNRWIVLNGKYIIPNACCIRILFRLDARVLHLSKGNRTQNKIFAARKAVTKIKW